MNYLYIVTTAALLLAVAAGAFRHRKPRGEYFANGVLVSITPKGRANRLADAAFPMRYLLCKAGSDASHIALCTAADQPLGVVPDMTPTQDATGDHSYPLAVHFLGLNEDTERMVASGAIAIDALVVAAASGKVKALPTSGGGTAFVVGKAVTAAAADLDQVEVIPCFPYQVTIAS